MELATPKVNISIDSKVIRLLVIICIALGLVGAFIVAKNLYSVSPTVITINTKNLSQAQHNALIAVVEPYKPESFFTANLPQIRDVVVSLDWVDQAYVLRDWRQGIVVTVLPRTAVARFGSEHLIDAQGQIYTPINEQDLNEIGLITLQGDKSQAMLIMQHMQRVNEWFAPIDIHVQDMILTPRMTWLIRFDNGLRLIVDNEDTTQKLISASHLLSNQLNPSLDEIDSIDLRYKNGFTISWKPQPLALSN